MSEVLQDSGNLESTTIGIFRSAATMAGGRRFSFGSLVAVGDRQGRVALGYAKANEVPPAIEKAQKEGKKNLKSVTLQGGTIPHMVEGRFGSARVRLMPASPGTGVVAGATVRAVLEIVGITDCMTKSYGSTNKKNLAKATLDGLTKLRAKESFAELRGVEIGATEVDERLERGKLFMPASSGSGEKMAAPVNTIGQDKRRGGRDGGGRGGRGGRSQQAEAPAASEAPATENAETPASESKDTPASE
ncbi:MAG: 30S ribosomal protein S5 [Planctomycetota bacterium]